MFEPRRTAVCAWTGLAPEGDEVVTCGMLATDCVEDRSGHRWYACPEHLAQIRARAGFPVNVLHLRPSPPPLISA